MKYEIVIDTAQRAMMIRALADLANNTAMSPAYRDNARDLRAMLLRAEPDDVCNDCTL